MTTLAIEAWQEGGNLTRLDGFRMIVEALGGAVEVVKATPPHGDDYWRLDITLSVPAGREARCEQIATHQFDGQVHMTVIP